MSDVKEFAPNTSLPVSLSSAAVAHIKQKVSDKAGAVGLRLAVKKAGCSGYMYVTDVVVKQSATDLPFEVDADLTIYIDKESFSLLNGVRIDYVEKDLGLKRLVFINPNQKGECGCGESFLV